MIPENPLDLFGPGKTIKNFLVRVAEQKYATELRNTQVSAARINGTRIELQPGKFITIKTAEQSKSEQICHLHFNSREGTFKVKYQEQEYSFSNLANNTIIYFGPKGAQRYSNEAQIPAETPKITEAEFVFTDTVNSASSETEELKAVGEELQEHQDS